MACYAPWHSADGQVAARPFACGKCIGCKLERSRQWAVRCMHEASLYDRNCFITLTFREPRFSLDYLGDFQPFMKKLRARFPKDKIRFYMCGEYGEINSRAHYHALLFNFDFSDKVLWKGGNGHGHALFRSKVLEELWPHGFSSIGSVTFESAGYVARYCTKVLSGDEGDDASCLDILDPDSGEIYVRVKEFARMSLKPGIALPWLERFKNDVRHDGTVVVNGVKARAPRYYREKIREQGVWEHMELSHEYGKHAYMSFKESEPKRLEARESVAKARLSLGKGEL